MDAQVKSEPQQVGAVKTRIERTNINCVPGDRLCKAEEKTMPAAGAYKSEDYIYASLAGQAIIHHLDNDFIFI